MLIKVTIDIAINEDYEKYSLEIQKEIKSRISSRLCTIDEVNDFDINTFQVVE